MLRAAGRLHLVRRAASLSSVAPRLGTIEAAYDPKTTEEGRMAWWSSIGAAPTKPDAKPYTLLLPPPNVTGSLHIGHALTVTLEDALARWRRMCGDSVQWIPGTDHAGIATQTVVERYIKANEGVDRIALGRDAFIERVWAWRQRYGDRIIEQSNQMGASLDWESAYFTLDAPRSQFVTDTFVKLYEQGLVFRDRRIVQWCPALRTVISDVEVDYMSIEAKPTPVRLPGREKPVTFGLIYRIAYPLEPVSSSPTDEVIIAATTRPETIFGDAALAVHPEDPRYMHLIGRHVLHPITGRRMPIIADAVLVDPSLGTGVVKVSPSLDASDFDAAQRNNLSLIDIFDDKCTLLTSTPPDIVPPAYAGLDRFDARFRVLADLSARGLLKGKDPYAMQLARCSRSGDVLEPRVKPQWFVRVRGDLANRARDLVSSGAIEVVPEARRAEWIRWLDESRDWCVSRQLWWGHRIPAYRVVEEGNASPTWFVAATKEEAQAQAARALGRDHVTLEQDEDVLDTWFSSALLPISAVPDAARRPLDALETGGDILTFWVSRMVLLCSHLHPSGAPPFRRVLLHPMVRDGSGRKMSKSLGNVVDPMNVIQGASLNSLRAELVSANISDVERKRGLDELSKTFPRGMEASGADALRMVLARAPQQAHFLNLDMKKVAASRAFGNKLWQAVRFLLHWRSTGQAMDVEHADLASFSAPHELWLLGALGRLEETVGRGMESFDLASASDAVYHFIRDDFCDVYINWARHAPNQARGILLGEMVMEATLRLLHPFMPFITEELWQHLTCEGRFDGGKAGWPVSVGHRPFPQKTMEKVDAEKVREATEVMKALEEMLASARIVGGKDKQVITIKISEERRSLFEENAGTLAKIVGVEKIIAE